MAGRVRVAQDDNRDKAHPGTVATEQQRHKCSVGVQVEYVEAVVVVVLDNASAGDDAGWEDAQDHHLAWPEAEDFAVPKKIWNCVM
jgi:hypothetical protein